MSGKPKFRAEQFIMAIDGSAGIISAIADRVGCSWNTAKKYITEHPTVLQAYENECERISDLAINTILNSIKGGDTADAKWWLARKRKEEFGAAVDITTKGEAIKGYVIVSPDDWDQDPQPQED